MKAGDLVQWSKVAVGDCKAGQYDIGMLLGDPIFPRFRFGKFPKQYRVLTKNGVEEWIDEYNTVVIKVTK